MDKKYLIDDERFWSKVNKTDGCWEWTSATDEKGYPLYWKDGACRRLRKFVNITDDLQISHLCKNKLCINLEHIEYETAGDNKRRDRGPGKVGGCKRQHPWSTRKRQPSGKLVCAECAKLDARDRYVAQRKG